MSVLKNSLNPMDKIAFCVYDGDQGALLVQQYGKKYSIQERDGSVWTQEWYKYGGMPFLRFADEVLHTNETVYCEYAFLRPLGSLS